MKPVAMKPRGMATLSICLLLIALAALVALFAQQSLVTEQRAAVNLQRAARAFTQAEAGLAWISASLHDPRPIDARCEPADVGPNLRERVLRGSVDRGYDPDTNLHVACRHTAGGLVCTCPPSGALPALTGRDAGGFALRFEPEPGDPWSVRVTATGCTEMAPPCVGRATDRPASSHAEITASFKHVPLVWQLPGAALTAGGEVRTGPGRITSIEPAGQGRLVEAGGSIDAGQAQLTGPPGTPAAAGLIAMDPDLSPWRREAPRIGLLRMLGRPLDALVDVPWVRRLAGDTPAQRGAALAADVAAGWTQFVADEPMDLPAGRIGSPARPLLVVSSSTMSCPSAACELHGLVVGATDRRAPDDLAGLSVIGAVVSLGDHVSTASFDVQLASQALQTLRHQSATLQRVPGSWRDHQP